MIGFLVIIVLLLILLVFIMVTPLIIKVDTAMNDYTFQWKFIGSVSVVPDKEEIIFIRYNIFFLKISTTP